MNKLCLLVLSGCTSFTPALPVFYESVEMALGVLEEVAEEIIEEEIEEYAVH